MTSRVEVDPREREAIYHDIFGQSNAVTNDATTIPQVVIPEALKKIEDANKIPTKVITHTLKQVENDKVNQTTRGKIIAGVVYSLMIMGVIGIGGLLYTQGIIDFGIPGISEGLSIGLLAPGGLAIIFWVLSQSPLLSKLSKSKNPILQNLSKISKEYETAKSHWFLDSNLNDLISVFAYLILVSGAAMSIINPDFLIHAPDWFLTLKGCAGYPLGFLLVTSGIYQLAESIKSLLIAFKIDDKSKRNQEIANIINSIFTLGLGVAAIGGWLNDDLGIIAGMGCGLLPLILAGYIFFKKTLPMKKELDALTNNPKDKDIKAFINKLTHASDSEIEQITKKYLNQTNCQDWIKNNISNFDEVQDKEIIEKIKLYEAEKNLKELQKIIIKEEIKKCIEQKLDYLRKLVNKTTFENILNEANDKAVANKERILPIFNDMKTQINKKYKAEIVKLVVFSSFVLIGIIGLIFNLSKPETQTQKDKIASVVYNGVSAKLSLGSLGVNISPERRNVPPCMDYDFLNIHKEDAAPAAVAPIAVAPAN